MKKGKILIKYSQNTPENSLYRMLRFIGWDIQKLNSQRKMCSLCIFFSLKFKYFLPRMQFIGVRSS